MRKDGCKRHIRLFRILVVPEVSGDARVGGDAIDADIGASVWSVHHLVVTNEDSDMDDGTGGAGEEDEVSRRGSGNTSSKGRLMSSSARTEEVAAK